MQGQILSGQMFPRQLPTNTNYPQSLVKIGSVLAEIFHYTETWTNVAWSNVPETFANEYRWPNQPTLKI